eukprot:1696144-Amphidinium_carterae.1
MAWFNQKEVEHLKHSFAAMTKFGIQMPSSLRKPGGSRPAQTPVTPGSKKWSAQQGVGWHCPSCKCYNFGFRALCFGCKVVARPGGFVPQGGASRKPVPSTLSKPWENLEHQLASEKDPE